MNNRLLDVNKLRNVSVLGMGRSGVEVARFFKGRGIEVFLSDSADIHNLCETTSLLRNLGIKYETGGHTDKIWKDADLVVISPGISIDNPVVNHIREKGISIISELELAFRLSMAPFVAITGTNGKSTTTTMIGSFLSAGGFGVIVGGNIGIPLVQKAYEATVEQVIVAEVSSFQLETVDTFRPYISLLLNLTSDHLNRHGTMENYLDLKCRIFKHQKEGDYVILNYDDPMIKNVAHKIHAQVLFFSSKAILNKGIFVNNGNIYYKNGTKEFEVCRVEDIPLPGEHNLQNSMAAILTSLIYGIPKETIRESILNFKGLRHRMEFVTEISGVHFIDDSKGTNPDAVMAALKSFNEPVILIAGGVDKDMDFSPLCALIAERVKGLVLIGTTADILAHSCAQKGLSNIERAFSMEEAVEKAFSMAEPGNIVLLSPAGASFDMFKNAEERGDKFVQAVNNLKHSSVTLHHSASDLSS